MTKEYRILFGVLVVLASLWAGNKKFLPRVHLLIRTPPSCSVWMAAVFGPLEEIEKMKEETAAFGMTAG